MRIKMKLRINDLSERKHKKDELYGSFMYLEKEEIVINKRTGKEVIINKYLLSTPVDYDNQENIEYKRKFLTQIKDLIENGTIEL
jgi:hypothetical protein